MAKAEKGRYFLAVFCGFLAGLLLSSAIGAGIQLHFPNENPQENWTILLWGEHWFLRGLTSAMCAWWAGFIAGVIGRKKGKLLGALSILPSLLLWVLFGYVAITGYFPFIDDGSPIHFSIGNKISVFIIIIVLIPIALNGGETGEEIGSDFGDHFDSRPYSLFGIKWCQYLWIPFVAHLVTMQVAYMGLYFLLWYRELARSSAGLFAYIIPTFFVSVLYGTLYLLGYGLLKAFLILSGLEECKSLGKRTLGVLKFGFGAPLLAFILQSGIQYIHYLLAKAFS